MYTLFVFLLGIGLGIIYSIWAMPRSNYAFKRLARTRLELLNKQSGWPKKRVARLRELLEQGDYSTPVDAPQRARYN